MQQVNIITKVKRIIFFFLVSTTVLFGQQSPQKIERLQPEEILAVNNVKSRIALVYSYTDSTFYDRIEKLDSDTQSVVSYNKLGQILSERSFRDFSELGNYVHTYVYDDSSRLATKTSMIRDSLLTRELFKYSSDNSLSKWIIKSGNDELSQSYVYNQHSDPIIITAKDNQGRTIRKDSICYLYDSLGRVKYEWSYNQDGYKVDEVIYSYQKQDTVWKKILLKDGVPSVLYAQIQKQSLRLEVKTDIVVFEDGWLLATRTKTYDKDDNLIQDRLRHPSVEWNYTKNFIYNREGLLIEKQVFEGDHTPTTVVFYSYEYFKE